MSTRYLTINTEFRKALNALSVTAKSGAVTLSKYYIGDVAPTSGPYLYSWLLTNEPDGAELGNDKAELITGIFQIDAYIPATADYSSNDLVVTDQISTAFYRGLRLPNNIEILNVRRGQPVISGGYIKTTIDVNFRTFQAAG